MNFLSIIGTVRKVLGKLTDILIKGRQAGLWTEKDKLPEEKGFELKKENKKL